MRRPSIPFEAIGLHTKIRRASLCATPALKEKTMTMLNEHDPRDPPENEVNKPAPTAPDNFEDDDDLEDDLDDEDDED